MKKIDKVAKVGDRILSVISIVIAAVLLIYSIYVVYDNFNVGRNAMPGRNLEQYKPIQKEDGTMDFRTIREINPDTVGWITVFNTNIDYPVAHTDNDIKYAITDIFGKPSLSGAIYLQASNSGDFIDNYNVIYGHHMDNGAMFGDLEKYLDSEYFWSHRDGLLLALNGNFDLRIFAALEVNAYDDVIYGSGKISKDQFAGVLSYVESHATQYVATDHSDVSKIIVLSTCATGVAATNSRIVVMADAIPRKVPIPNYQGGTEDVVRTPEAREGIDNWALLNLICLILTVITLIPITHIRKKYRQIPYSRDTANEMEDPDEGTPMASYIAMADPDHVKNVINDLRAYLQKMYLGLLLEIIAALVAIFAFILTEDMRLPMTIVDRWTPVMIAIYAIAFIVDFICFRYRGERPPELDEENEE